MRSPLILPIFLAVTGIALAAAPASRIVAEARADAGTIKKRQDILGSFGEAVKEPGAMLRQEAAFDLAVVKASLKTIKEGAPKLKELFPDDSKTGGYTEALPVIWEQKAAFWGVLDQLVATAAAAETQIKDETTFRTEWGKVSANCRACHKVYRTLPKS